MHFLLHVLGYLFLVEVLAACALLGYAFFGPDSPRSLWRQWRARREWRGLAAALLVLPMLVGCASTPPDRMAYATIDGATEAVQTSMRVFNDLYQQGKFTKADRTKVIKAYEDFRVVALAAANVSPTLTAEHKSATEKVSAAAVELLRLVEHFTKPKSARASPPVLTFRTEVLAWS